ncbi:16753_t:CDS:1 [Dentiscutata erythropus]|uniref:16753_t:CDS:1 n=1 Tax=Dentiscutata erythropus TaxID=1348616 RepID=A0A9N9NQH0_9GLOM|nr:16753_t:CDS:1 [Dentiscutata erythropus]
MIKETPLQELAKELKFLINNQLYSDLEIVCKDGVILFGSRAILAARSKVLDGMLYNGMKETHEKRVKFPNINSKVFLFVLEFIYTSSITNDSLTFEEAIEIYRAADFLQLPTLQDIIIKFIKYYVNKNKQLAPNLLTEAVRSSDILAHGVLINTLIEIIAKIPLDSITFERLSIQALNCLLSARYDRKVQFLTQEYHVLRYVILHTANMISKEAHEIFELKILKLENFEKSEVGNHDEISELNKFNSNITKQITPLLKFINWNHIDNKIIEEIIQPLKIVPEEILKEAYTFKANKRLIFKEKNGNPFKFDSASSGKQLIFNEDYSEVSSVVTKPEMMIYQSVRSQYIITESGEHEWEVIIEEIGDASNCYIGICDEYCEFNTFLGNSVNAWVFNRQGTCWNNGIFSRYGSEFNVGDTITVHVDMDQRTCAFSVNGKRHPPVNWTNLPSKLYPIVSFRNSGRLRIQSHVN